MQETIQTKTNQGLLDTQEVATCPRCKKVMYHIVEMPFVKKTNVWYCRECDKRFMFKEITEPEMYLYMGRYLCSG
jgi:ribosomal protein L37AE/L43A